MSKKRAEGEKVAGRGKGSGNSRSSPELCWLSAVAGAENEAFRGERREEDRRQTLPAPSGQALPQIQSFKSTCSATATIHYLNHYQPDPFLKPSKK